jgi:hypothetical protein
LVIALMWSAKSSWRLAVPVTVSWKAVARR